MTPGMEYLEEMRENVTEETIKKVYTLQLFMHLHRNGVAGTHPVAFLSQVDGEIRISYGMQNEAYIRQVHLENGLEY